MKYRIIFVNQSTCSHSTIMPLLTEEESALDPYRILGLEVGATDKEITKAYRKKALIWHSDKNQSEEARTSNISPV
jgi:DnaJ-class molecular chaperone